MAVDHHLRGDLMNAEMTYREAIKTGYRHSATFLNLGVICTNSGRTEEAIFLYEKAIEISPDNHNIYTNLGNLFRGLDRLDQALALTLKSLRLKPNNPDALINLGGIYKDLGQLDKALESTFKALELNPDHPAAHMNLGVIYKGLGQLDQALESTLRSIELNPNNPDAQSNLGGIYKDLGQLNQALTSTLESLELKTDNHTAIMNLGGIYRDLGQLDQALTTTLRAQELNPDNPTAYMNLGVIYQDLSDYTNAEKEVDIAIKMNASHLDICQRLKAACLYQKQEYDDAIELLYTLKAESIYTEKSLWETETALRSVIYAKNQKLLQTNSPNSALDKKIEQENKKWIIKKYLDADEDLIRELVSIESKELSYTMDTRNGAGFCTNFQLFENKLPTIQQLASDLTAIVSESLAMEADGLKYDSFFNVFNSGAGTTPHTHIKPYDMNFGLWKHKYSLVYYLDVGDQDGEHPGILQMYDPADQILPEKGMIIIVPATRLHSSYYEGTRSRLMVGANFYAFSKDLT